jgi:16S rRNA (cytosine967-C5)-methyltransferase
MVDKARNAALKLLRDIDIKKGYINLEIKPALKDNSLSTLDRAFITDIVYGVTRYRLTLDWLIKRYSRGGKASPWIRNILRMGMYQILYMDRVPDFAACDSSVELAKKYAGQREAGYVNAVLRRLIQEKDDLVSLFPQDTVSRIALKYSFPEWMVRLWLNTMSETLAEELCAAQNIRPSLTIRANELKISQDGLIKLLEQRSIMYSCGVYLPEALNIEQNVDVESLPGYDDGLFAVQDEASMMVAHVVDPRPGQIIIDACSAPGGKAVHMAQFMKDQGRILSVDVYPHRIELIKAQCARLGVNCIEPVCYDSTVYNEDWYGMADAVLIDAPCSGLGIIRHKPDIKWRRAEKDIGELLQIQRQILDTCSLYVKPRGVLIYSTCTINPDENQNMVNSFLNDHSDFILDDVYQKLPHALSASRDNGDKWVQFYPNEDKIDGFFVARMLKVR